MSEKHWNEFEALKGALAREFEQLIAQNQRLKRENQRLREELSKKDELKKPDIFSNLSENDRLAFKQRVKALIDKLDKHLDIPKEV